MTPPKFKPVWLLECEAIRRIISSEAEKRELDDVRLSVEFAKMAAEIGRRLDSLEVSVSSIDGELVTLRRRIDESKRESLIDEEFERKVFEALSKPKSEFPDIEVTTAQGTKFRGRKWPVLALAIAILAFLGLVVQRADTLARAWQIVKP